MPVGDTDYAATSNLTALASTGNGIEVKGYHQTDLVAQLKEMETNLNGILTKLDVGSGVTDPNYNALYSVDLNDVVASDGSNEYAYRIVDAVVVFNCGTVARWLIYTNTSIAI